MIVGRQLPMNFRATVVSLWTFCNFSFEQLVAIPFASQNSDMNSLVYSPVKMIGGVIFGVHGLPKRCILLLCQVKEMCVCAFIIVVLCDAQSTMHSYAILIIECQISLIKKKNSIYGEFFHVFLIISPNN
jgi:hypothetical protein